MPEANGLGYSRYTYIKQVIFRKFILMHLTICKNKVSKDRRYTYFDLNAGPGYYESLIGSPLEFIEAAEQVALHYRAIFIEQQECWHQQLQQHVDDRQEVLGTTYGEIEVILGDHEQAMRDSYLRDRTLSYGLVYADPTGSIPCFDLLGTLSNQRSYQRMDFLISVSATNIKRIRGAYGGPSLENYIESIGKSYWIIREPYGRHQWTFLVGTNWSGFPCHKRAKFHRLNSDDGRRILDILSHSAREIELEERPINATATTHQLALPDIPRVSSSSEVSEDTRYRISPRGRLLREVPQEAGN